MIKDEDMYECQLIIYKENNYIVSLKIVTDPFKFKENFKITKFTGKTIKDFNEGIKEYYQLIELFDQYGNYMDVGGKENGN
jgi:hypothetical protein